MTTDSSWLAKDEAVVISGFANKIGFWGGPGGQLVLTDHRLVFTNRRKTRVLWDCPLREVLFVGPGSNATIWSIALIVTLLVGNAIKVTVKGGASQRFVVNDKTRWIALINERRTIAA